MFVYNMVQGTGAALVPTALTCALTVALDRIVLVRISCFSFCGRQEAQYSTFQQFKFYAW